MLCSRSPCCGVLVMVAECIKASAELLKIKPYILHLYLLEHINFRGSDSSPILTCLYQLALVNDSNNFKLHLWKNFHVLFSFQTIKKKKSKKKGKNAHSSNNHSKYDVLICTSFVCLCTVELPLPVGREVPSYPFLKS